MNRTITLINTTRCNFKCKHCIRDFYTKHYDTPLPILIKAFKEADELGMNHIAITGGEAILHPNFQEIIDLIKKHNFTWSVVTNGSFTKKYSDVIDTYREKLKYIALSFDGGTEKTHDFIRKEGSFKEVIKAAEFYKSKGLYVRLLYTVNSKNIEEIPEFVKIATTLKVDSLRFAGITSTGYTNELEITWEQKLKVYEYIFNLRQKLRIDITHTNSLFAETDAEKFCPVINDHEPTINPYGDYIFCCNTVAQGAVLGSLKKESFSELYLKGLRQAAELKKERARRILKKEFFKDFNSCHFCNFLLKEKFRAQRLFVENK